MEIEVFKLFFDFGASKEGVERKNENTGNNREDEGLGSG